jgi:hypothetical protein
MDRFTARGHPLITSLHGSTLEITKDPEVGPKGNCIIAVSSSRGCRDLSEGVKRAIWEGSEMYLLLKIGDVAEEIRGFGHPDLELSHPDEMVFRKSEFISPRTVLIRSDRSASDLSREFVEMLRNRSEVQVTLGRV